MSFKLYLDENTIKDATNSRKGFLTVPSDEDNPSLYQKGDNVKFKEHFEVKGTRMALAPDDKSIAIVTLQLRIRPDGPYRTNAGRVVMETFWLDIPAFTDSSHPSFKRTQMNLGRLNSFIRACGLEIEKDESGRVPYHDYFNAEEGDVPPLVGKKFIGVVRQYVYTNKTTKELTQGQNIDNFIPEDE